MAQTQTIKVDATGLQRPIESLGGVGLTRGKLFRALGVHTLGDLLEYFPRDYIMERSEQPISQLRTGQLQFARGEVVAVDYVARYPKPRFEAEIDDGTGSCRCTWFFGSYLQGKIYPGLVLRVQGQVKIYRDHPEMINPKWRIIEPDAERIGEDRLRAIYPATARLTSDIIGQIISRNIDKGAEVVEEWFDAPLLKRRGLSPRKQAYHEIHCPPSYDQAAAARRRLIYDELILMQLGLGIAKRIRRGGLRAPDFKIDKLLDDRIRRRFPFELTEAQQRSIWDIVKDLQGTEPMNRLLQGDVGSGKTVVALYAMLVAIANRHQAAILAPTEVLAEQHYLTLSNLLKDSKVRIALVTGRTKRESRGSLLRKLAAGEIDLAIGTQALIQDDVEFSSLGLVVVDEQHKLGVRQRGVLKNKGLAPHHLIMTATPIPRSLALSYFADFDLSVIDQLPPGRRPIQTRWLRGAQADGAFAFVREHISAGRQAYVVLPQIEEDGLEDHKSVLQEYARLSKGPLKDLRLAVLHGQMSTADKQATMGAFRDGKIDVLVATTVIEVGIDVPNATVMVIEDADRFGLSQLHQLRGRVGRGSIESHCLLVGDAPSEESEQRLLALTRTNDGFAIAEADMKLRGPGEFFGTRQHGLPQLKLADITKELELLKTAREDALEILAKDPNLYRHRALRTALEKQFGGALEWAQVG